ncbi:MAG: chorismate synthase [Methanomicrobiales archaeon]
MNTFGRYFRCTTFGESHGPAVGVVVDGCPPQVPVTESDIQPYLDRRRPGTGPLVSARREPDTVSLISGVCEGHTTGAPIAMIVSNRDAQSAAYDDLARVFRPGHADYSWEKKFGIRDHRGGGRTSGRETVGRVAAGALAMTCLHERGISITSRILEIHGETDPGRFDEEIRRAREAGDSVGGVLEVIATGCPPGLGDPVFGKLDAVLAGGMMGIGGVKGVEIGSGFGAARMMGSQHNDPISGEGFLSNHAGGILGGISTGQEIVVRCAVKPTSSIALPQQTIDEDGCETTITVTGRHDPCLVPRVAPVAEAMCALVLMDAVLSQAAITRWRSVPD